MLNLGIHFRIDDDLDLSNLCYEYSEIVESVK